MSDESDALYDEAVGLLEKNEAAAALEALERCLMADAEDAQAWRLYSVVLGALGRPEDAARASAKADALGMDPVDALLMKAVGATVSGNKAQAICHYEDALEINGESFEIWVAYALLLLEEGYQKDALEASAKAVEFGDGEPQAWYARGRVLRLNGELDPALAAFDRAVGLDAQLAPAWYERGMVLDGTERYPEALECFEKVLGLTPDDPSAKEAEQIIRSKLENGTETR